MEYRNDSSHFKIYEMRKTLLLSLAIGIAIYLIVEIAKSINVIINFIFKWNETRITVKRILEIINAQPLFGHKSGKASKTHWMCFMKFPDAV